MSKKQTMNIYQFKSGSGYPSDQKATLTGLGLKKLNRIVEIEDTPAVRGMIQKVCHLVRIEPGE